MRSIYLRITLHYLESPRLGVDVILGPEVEGPCGVRGYKVSGRGLCSLNESTRIT